MKQGPSLWHLGEETHKEPLRYTGCGLDDVWLVSGYDTEVYDGEMTLTVRDLDGLHAAIGRSLIKRKKLLSGKEIRFLRQQLNLSQAKLAGLVGCDSQQVARYEKEQNRMPGPMDRLLRMLFREHLADPIRVQDFLEALEQLDGRMEDRQVFEATPDGWKTAA